LLAARWCGQLSERLRRHPILSALIPPAWICAQCLYFEKSADRNWLVALHQDRSIPVQRRVDAPGLTGWAEKDGETFVHGTREVLEMLVVARLHLDDCLEEDGPLRVVPGSHRFGILTDEAAGALRRTRGERRCEMRAGGVLLMRPLTLHASSKSSGAGRRRVLHFVFGPPDLPGGLTWAGAAASNRAEPSAVWP